MPGLQRFATDSALTESVFAVSPGEAGSPGSRAGGTTSTAEVALEIAKNRAGGLEKETRPTPPQQSKCLLVNGSAQYSSTTEPEVEGSSGEAGSSWSGVDDTTSADDSTVAKASGAAQPPGTAAHGVSTAFELAVSSGEGSAQPGGKDTTNADVTAVARPAGEARPFLGAHRTVPRQNLNSQCPLVKLGFFGPE